MNPNQIILDLLEVMEAAIDSGDWVVDGACDPDLAIIRAYKFLEESGNNA